MPRPRLSPGAVRKLVEIDGETWTALTLLGIDSVKSFDELVDEAFGDLLRKLGRPVLLKDALRRSAEVAPNDNRLRSRRAR